MARGIEFNYDKAIDSATRLFWKSGYSNTSLRDLLKVMKIGEGSFYNTIKSKKNLYLLCLKHYVDTIIRKRQAVLFAAATLIVSFPSVRRLATPHFLKRHRVLSLARQHFVSTGLHLANGQPHVLIFLALAERRVEIVAGADVHRMAGERAWSDASDAVAAAMRGGDPTSGIVRAIEIAGAPLIEHFPATRQGQAQGMAEL